MCAYCFIGDHQFKYDPPWHVPDTAPFIPSPLIPPSDIKPWKLDRLLEFEELLKRVKELEDRLGCPCEPNKADYLKLIRERIEKLQEMG